MNRMGWTGLTMIIISVATFASWKAWFNSRTWTPIDDTPISLAQGSHYSSPEFPVNISQQYVIEIDVDNKIARETLRCQLGSGSPQKPCDPPSLFKAHWALSSEGRMVEEGFDTPNELTGLADGTESIRYVAFLRLKKGSRYKLDFDVLSDSASLNIANPRLNIVEFGAQYEFCLVVTGLLKVACFAIAIMGALLLIVSTNNRRSAP